MLGFEVTLFLFSEFRQGRSPILIATDVAARGLGMYIALFLFAMIFNLVSVRFLFKIFGFISGLYKLYNFFLLYVGGTTEHRASAWLSVVGGDGIVSS